MVEPEPKAEPSAPAAQPDIPSAFSKCANCSISYQDSPNPVESVLLVCLHSFCLKCINEGCLRSDKGDSNLVTCCKCKCNSNRADCGINLLADVAYENKNTIKCSSCNDQTSATSRCTVCNDMLCDACVSAHKRVKLTRDHPIVPLPSPNGVSNGVTQSGNKSNKRYACSKHASEKLQLSCELCNKVTCPKCHAINGEHFNHPSTDINQAAASFRNNLKHQLQNLQEKDKTVSTALSVVMEKMADIDGAENKALSEVKEYYNTCMEALRNRMNSLGSEIRKLASNKRAMLEKMKDDMGHLQSRLDETSRTVHHAADCGDPIALLSVRKGMSHHMATLLKLKCQVPNPSHKLNIQLQTDPALLTQVIPQLGNVLVDGLPSGQSPPHTVSQASMPSATTHYMSNGISSHQTTHNTALKGHRQPSASQLSPLLRMGGQPRTVHHRPPVNPSPIQSQHPMLFSQVNSASQQSQYRPLSYDNHQTAKYPSGSSRTPSPSTSAQTKLQGLLPPSLPSTSTTEDRWHPDAASILRQAAVEVSTKANASPSSSLLNLHLEGNTDPLNVNSTSTVAVSKPSTERQDSLKISSVMSLADNGASNGATNGQVTPPKDHLQVARKRKKTALSPFHVSLHHAPDDPNEDYCAVCHNGGDLYCCDTCPKVYHVNCHVPELVPLAHSIFSCSLCWDDSMPPTPQESISNKGPLSKRKAPSGLSDYEMKLCEKILLKMSCLKESIPFHTPVPKTVKYYSTYIKNPIDFMAISKKLTRQHFNHYDSVKEFIKDMRLVFSNCVAFNGPKSEYTRCAQIVQQAFVDEIKKYFAKYAELAATILTPPEVMNMHLVKKRTSSTDLRDESDPVVHIS